jgi:hypothetical protein
MMTYTKDKDSGARLNEAGYPLTNNGKALVQVERRCFLVPLKLCQHSLLEWLYAALQVLPCEKLVIATGRPRENPTYQSPLPLHPIQSPLYLI